MTRYFASDPQVVRLSVSAVVWREAGARQLLLMQRSDNGYWGSNPLSINLALDDPVSSPNFLRWAIVASVSPISSAVPEAVIV